MINERIADLLTSGLNEVILLSDSQKIDSIWSKLWNCNRFLRAACEMTDTKSKVHENITSIENTISNLINDCSNGKKPKNDDLRDVRNCISRTIRLCEKQDPVNNIGAIIEIVKKCEDEIIHSDPQKLQQTDEIVEKYLELAKLRCDSAGFSNLWNEINADIGQIRQYILVGPDRHMDALKVLNRILDRI